MDSKWAYAVLAALIGGAAVYGLVDQGDSEAVREAQARVERAEAVNERLVQALVYTDSVADAQIADAESMEARADTLWRSTIDTVRAAVPDSLKPAVDRLQAAYDSVVRADSIDDAAYENKLAARDSVIRGMDAELEAKAALVEKLRDELDPPWYMRAFGGFGEGAVRVGVVGIALATENYGAAAGAGAMWAVSVAF